jgi:hypothetical protein
MGSYGQHWDLGLIYDGHDSQGTIAVCKAKKEIHPLLPDQLRGSILSLPWRGTVVHHGYLYSRPLMLPFFIYMMDRQECPIPQILADLSLRTTQGRDNANSKHSPLSVRPQRTFQQKNQGYQGEQYDLNIQPHYSIPVNLLSS